MRKTRFAAAVAAIAVVGLMVSLSAVWSSLGSEPTVRESGRGPYPAFTSEWRASGEAVVPREEKTVSRPGRAAAVGRSTASLTDGRAAPRTPRPVRVEMGSVSVDARVRPVGVARNGQMALPADPAVLGWYKYGPSPDAAARGSTVLAGHLDSKRFGLGPLVRLREVRVGDALRVTLSNGARTTYRVVRVARFDRQGLPAQLFARTGPHRLRVITCGGEYDPQDGGYQKNLVVTAVPS